MQLYIYVGGMHVAIQVCSSCITLYMTKFTIQNILSGGDIFTNVIPCTETHGTTGLCTLTYALASTFT